MQYFLRSGVFFIYLENGTFCRLLTAKSRSARGASRQPASMGSSLTIFQMCLPCTHLVDGCGCSPRLSSGNKETVN